MVVVVVVGVGVWVGRVFSEWTESKDWSRGRGWKQRTFKSRVASQQGKVDCWSKLARNSEVGKRS